jgi:hypothetical protein
VCVRCAGARSVAEHGLRCGDVGANKVASERERGCERELELSGLGLVNTVTFPALVGPNRWSLPEIKGRKARPKHDFFQLYPWYRIRDVVLKYHRDFLQSGERRIGTIHSLKVHKTQQSTSRPATHDNSEVLLRRKNAHKTSSGRRQPRR